MCEVTIALNRLKELGGEEQACCWICLDDASPSNPLISPCVCPRLCHRSCLSRWQLQSAGKPEEKSCRFCESGLPDWKLAHEDLPRAAPMMTVVHNGVQHQLAVQPGPAGREAFLRQVRCIFGLEDNDSIALSFGCRVPGTGEAVCLEGLDSFDAAVHCASITAGQRMEQEPAGSSSICPREGRGASSGNRSTVVQALQRLFRGGQ